ncbi:MAG: hypothetical protein ABSF89_14740 [Acidimicrobiales bacterium]
MTAPSPAVPSSREAPPGELLVCHSCLLLKGPVPGRTDGARQFCDCTPGEVRRAQSRWGGDFNTYAELCRCCGLVLLRSGSRFSIWFCMQWLEAIKALNRSAGRSLVPIGRHSFMNGVGASAAQLRTESGARALAEQFAYLLGKERSLEGWARTIVQRNLTELGLDIEQDARLADYLDAVSGSALSPRAAFEALLSAAADRSLAKLSFKPLMPARG